MTTCAVLQTLCTAGERYEALLNSSSVSVLKRKKAEEGEFGLTGKAFWLEIAYAYFIK